MVMGPTVRSDDVLLDRVGRGERPDAERLTHLLVSWRDEVRSAGPGELVATRGLRRARWWRRVTQWTSGCR